MKTERKQELKTNDLGAFIVDTAEWIQKYGYQFGGGAALIILAIVAVSMVRRSNESASADAWGQLSSIDFSVPDATEAFTQVNHLIAESPNRDFKLQALLVKGANGMAKATAPDGFHPEYLDKADSAYQELLNAFPERLPVKANALANLATIEESRFVKDGDKAHEAAARKYLEQLRDDPQFKGTVYQTSAAQRLMHLDRSFTEVALAAPLPPAEKKPADAGPTPLPPDGVKIQPIVVPSDSGSSDSTNSDSAPIERPASPPKNTGDSDSDG